MTATLELAENTLRGHFALEVFDSALDALVADLDLESLALNCFARISQGSRGMADRESDCKPQVTAWRDIGRWASTQVGPSSPAQGSHLVLKQAQ